MTNIQTGDIILVKGSTPIISPLVKWFTGSEYSHAGVAVGDNMIYEIDMNKDLAIRPLSRHKSYDVYRLVYGLSDNEKQDLVDLMLEKAKENKGYDWLRILSFVLEKIFRKPFVLDEKNNMICSEIVDVLYYNIGIDLFPDKQLGDVAPGDLPHSIFLEKVDQSID